jgi:hypothetical protein
MFVSAIEKAALFTRPIHIVTRNYKSSNPVAGAATMFFVNSDGWALTCRHVAQHLVASDAVSLSYANFRSELAAGVGKVKEKHLRRELEKKYGYTDKTVVQILNRFVGCVDTFTNIDVKPHPDVDLALLKFNGFSAIGSPAFPVFAKDEHTLKQGKFLCRLGFPFPEFTNFAYDPVSDSVAWQTYGRESTPQFPIEGMLTRHLQLPDGTIVGFEMSTPGLRGQSGGPAFDLDGRVWGMQSATNHLDLDFDVDQEVVRKGVRTRVKDSAFLHVGYCVHVGVVKSFMRANGVAFQEG